MPQGDTGHALLAGLNRVHTTQMGAERIRRNLGLHADDPAAWCRRQIENARAITRRGKNWYVRGDGCVITVNATSFTIITAHRDKEHGVI